MTLLIPVPVWADGCTPYDSSNRVCDSSVSQRVLADVDVPDAYKGFVFSTQNYAFDRVVFSDGWRVVESDNKSFTDVHVPERTGVYAVLPNVGTWTDPYGAKHPITARITVADANSGAFCSFGGVFGFNVYDGGYTSKRLGVGVRISFTYTDTGEPVPADFHGVAGFADLDGNNTSEGEGVELVQGFNARYLIVNDTHLQPFGQNGYMGVDQNSDQLDTTTEHARQHMFVATFTGPEITLRYSTSTIKSGSAMIFAVPIFRDAIILTITAKAIDQNGKTLRTWTVADHLTQGATWNLNPPAIDGYVYDGLTPDSAPLTGTIDKTSQHIILKYRPAINATSMPQTGVIGNRFATWMPILFIIVLLIALRYTKKNTTGGYLS